MRRMRSLLVLVGAGLVGLAGCTTSGSGGTAASGSPPGSTAATDSTPPVPPGSGLVASPVAPGPSGTPARPGTIPPGRVTLEVRPLIAPPAPVRCGSACSGDPFAALGRAGAAVPATAAGFEQLPAARQRQITDALGRAECSITSRQHGPYLIACDRGQNTGSPLAFLLGDPVFVADDVRSASATAPNPAQGSTEWAVQLRLTPPATNALAKWTSAHNTAGRMPSASITACAPSATPCGDYLAVVVDGRVITNPYTNSPITGGRMQLSGRFTEQSAKRLAAGLP